jgi:hypothetical protein
MTPHHRHAYPVTIIKRDGYRLFRHDHTGVTVRIDDNAFYAAHTLSPLNTLLGIRGFFLLPQSGYRELGVFVQTKADAERIHNSFRTRSQKGLTKV